MVVVVVAEERGASVGSGFTVEVVAGSEEFEVWKRMLWSDSACEGDVATWTWGLLAGKGSGSASNDARSNQRR